MKNVSASMRWLPLAALLILVTVCGRAYAALPEFTQLVKEHSPAVVNISTTQKVSLGTHGLPPGVEPMPDLPPDHPLREFLDRFLGEGEGLPPESFDAQSLGSGFIISADGHIITNYHVVRDADEVIVRLSDRREFVAEVVGHDERSDLALLRIDARNLPVVKFGKSSDLEVGEWVLAIGSPFGFEHSATAGIVSAKGRSLPRENYVPFIQTDVAINPGNSGGPLFNLAGEVVGVNSQIYSRTGGFMGLSFAIPIELAMEVAEQLRSSGRVTRGWLGILIQDVTRDLAESFGMSKPAGALVAQVLPDSPADKAGIRVGDIVIEYAGREIYTSAELPPLVGRTAVNESVKIKVIRDGKPRTLKVTIEELPEESDIGALPDQATPEKSGFTSELLGLTADELDKEQLELLGAPGGGVVVIDIQPGPAYDSGVAPGDVITQIDQQPIKDLESLRKAIENLPRGKSIPMLVIREGSPRFIALKLDESDKRR